MKDLTAGNAQTVSNWLADAQETSARIHGQSEVLELLQKESQVLMDGAFRARALGQESVGKQKEEIAKYLLSLVASLPSKLRKP